jgi:hypothetical protein
MAKAPAKRAQQSLEDQAWGSAPKAAPAKKAPATAKKPGPVVKATVSLKKNNLPLPKPVDLSKAKPGKARHAEQAAISTDDKAAPGMPRDFGTDSEAQAYLQDIEDSQGGVKTLLSQLTKKDYKKLPTGLSGINALQPDLEKALNNPNIADGDREALKSKIQERDVALYMLGASLVAQKKDYQAGMYLKFLAKSAQPGTPMKEAAQQQLTQIGQ